MTLVLLVHERGLECRNERIAAVNPYVVVRKETAHRGVGRGRRELQRLRPVRGGETRDALGHRPMHYPRTREYLFLRLPRPRSATVNRSDAAPEACLKFTLRVIDAVHPGRHLLIEERARQHRESGNRHGNGPHHHIHYFRLLHHQNKNFMLIVQLRISG